MKRRNVFKTIAAMLTAGPSMLWAGLKQEPKKEVIKFPEKGFDADLISIEEVKQAPVLMVSDNIWLMIQDTGGVPKHYGHYRWVCYEDGRTLQHPGQYSHDG